MLSIISDFSETAFTYFRIIDSCPLRVIEVMHMPPFEVLSPEMTWIVRVELFSCVAYGI